MHGEIVRVSQDAEIRKRFVNDGGDPRPSATPEAFANFIRTDMPKWMKVVRGGDQATAVTGQRDAGPRPSTAVR